MILTIGKSIRCVKSILQHLSGFNNFRAGCRRGGGYHSFAAPETSQQWSTSATQSFDERATGSGVVISWSFYRLRSKFCKPLVFWSMSLVKTVKKKRFLGCKVPWISTNQAPDASSTSRRVWRCNRHRNGHRKLDVETSGLRPVWKLQKLRTSWELLVVGSSYVNVKI